MNGRLRKALGGGSGELGDAQAGAKNGLPAELRQQVDQRLLLRPGWHAALDGVTLGLIIWFHRHLAARTLSNF